MSLTIGSLFSGIGGLELGLERAGLGPVVWQVEKDAYCRAVLAKHWPFAQMFEDVREIGPNSLDQVDVICGGFPCQDISYAGRGAGLAGERSGLWYEYARIIREMEPRYVVVENVAALLDLGIGDVLGTLADLGFDAEWSCIRAADVGAPHLRDRIFLVAYANGVAPQSLRGFGFLGDPTRGDSAARGERQWVRNAASRCGEDVADSDSARLEGRSQTLRPKEGRLRDAGHHRSAARGIWRDNQWAVEPDVGRVAHGVPARVDRLRALGNSVVPQVAEVVGRRILDIESGVGSPPSGAPTK